MIENELINELNNHIPFVTFPTRHLVSCLKKNDFSINQNSHLKVINVIDSGDIGGITCEVLLDGNADALIVSITHLKVQKDHPLRNQILRYKRERVSQLKK